MTPGPGNGHAGPGEHEPWFVPGSIRGARFWVVDVSEDGTPGLLSPRTRIAWDVDGKPTRAACPLGCARPPGGPCDCGIYAYHPGSRMFRPQLVTGREVHKGLWTVWGEVEAWGEIEVHADGFRAEFALPVSLYVPSLMPAGVRRHIGETADVHGIPASRERGLTGRRRRPSLSGSLSSSFRRTLLAA